LFEPECPVKFFASPRQAAAAPRAENIVKCQLKRLDFASRDSAGVAFTADQQARLRAVFPDGVCVWRRRGVGQVPVNPGPLSRPGWVACRWVIPRSPRRSVTDATIETTGTPGTT
jgi:hypothetical protein